MSSSKRAKTGRLDLRVDAQDRALFERAAREQRQSLTQFLVESGRERAERLLADRMHFRLDADQWSVLEAALDRPAEIKPKVADLFSRPRPE